MPDKKFDDKIERHIREPINNMMNAMNSFFNERPPNGILQSIDGFFGSPSHLGGGLLAELKENEKEYIVVAQLAGVKKEDIEIEVLHQHVTISVKSMTKERRSSKESSRTIPLTKPIIPEKVVAAYENGLLQVMIPKRQGKRIQIK